MLDCSICSSLLLFRRTALIIIVFIGTLTTTNTTQAQQVSSVADAPAGKSAIGLKLSIMPYDAIGSPEYRMPALDVPFVYLSYNYSVSNRAVVQIGLGYGMNEAEYAGISRHIDADSIYMKESYQRLSAIAIPVTFKWTPFNPEKRLQFYGHAAITPLFRHITARATESLNGGSTMRTELYNKNISSFTAVASAGLTMRYRFSDRWSAYVEGDLIYYSFERQHLATSLKKGAKSIGIYYNFNLKSSK